MPETENEIQMGYILRQYGGSAGVSIYTAYRWDILGSSQGEEAPVNQMVVIGNYDDFTPAREAMESTLRGVLWRWEEDRLEGDIQVYNAYVVDFEKDDDDGDTPPDAVLNLGVTTESIDVSPMGYGFIGSNVNGIQVIDVTDPVNPSWLSSVGGVGFNTHGVFWTNPNLVVAAADDGANGALQIFDVTNPAIPSVLASVLAAPPLPPGRAVCVVGARAFMVHENNMVSEWDISNPLAPLNTGQYAFATGLGGSLYGIREVDASAIVVADSDDGVRFIDISVPGFPSLASHMPGMAVSTDVRVTAAGPGQTAFVTRYNTGVVSLDVTNVIFPVILGSVDIPTLKPPMRAVEYEPFKNQIYVSNDTNIAIIEVSDPVSMQFDKQLTTDGNGNAQSLALNFVYLFAATDMGNILVYNVG
jgi:hypothetical protein